MKGLVWMATSIFGTARARLRVCRVVVVFLVGDVGVGIADSVRCGGELLSPRARGTSPLPRLQWDCGRRDCGEDSRDHNDEIQAPLGLERTVVSFVGESNGGDGAFDSSAGFI